MKSGSVTVYSNPSAPGTPSVSYAHTSTTLTKPGAPSGVTYYWQTTSSGVSTSNSSTTKSFSSSGTYYLRARHNTSGLWSSMKSGSVTVYSNPSTPTSPTASYADGSTTLTKAGAPSGVSYYWQTTSSGVSTSNSSTTKSFSSSGTYYLRARHNTSGLWSSMKSGSVTVYSNPSTPTSPTASYADGSTTLTKPGAPSGVTYYWQTSSSGVSTSNSSSTKSFSSSGTYYLRARHNTSGLWSSIKSGSVTVYSNPSTPTSPTASYADGSTTLTKVGAPSGVTYYWQTTSSGTSTSNSSSTKSFSSSGTYYLRARHNTSGLWSSMKSGSVTVYSNPSTPGTPSVSYAHTSTTLTKPGAPSGVTYYWQTTSSGVSTSNSSSTKSFSSSGTYYLRARHTTSGLWSSMKSGSVTVYSNPSTPTSPTASYADGSTTLTKTSAPSGVTYYWQTTSSGVSTSNSSTTKSFSSSGTYYLRARHNTSLLWSSMKSGSVTVYSNPSTPTSPTASYADGSTTLTKAGAPSGVTYYWQTTSSGVSTSNSSSTKSFSNSGTYYLRARHNISLLWSSIKSGGVTIFNKPNLPQQVEYTYLDGKTLVKLTNAPTGETYYWQTSPNGTATTDSQTEKEFLQTTTSYLRSRRDAPSYLWSDAKSVEINVTSAKADYSNKNYVSQIIIAKKGITDASSIEALNCSDKSETIQYFDGLGRPLQAVSVKATPDMKDLIQPFVYDDFGREAKNYLPFSTDGFNNGAYFSNDTLTTNWTKHYGSTESEYAFAEKELENSPLSRVMEQGAPGEPWQIVKIGGVSIGTGHTVKMSYLSNQVGEVLNYEVNASSGALQIGSETHYEANQLYKTVTKDENWTNGKAHTTEEFKDKQGQVILKRTWLDDSTPLNTYYVYDDYGLLRYVLPPQAFADGNSIISSDELTGLCYQYKYDSRKRMTHKKLPGAQEVRMVYDKRDRLVATQDGLLRKYGNWMFTKYDALNRPILTGIYSNDVSQNDLQTLVDGFTGTNLYEEKGAGALGYTIRSFPISDINEYYTANFYDTYPDFGPEYDFDEFGKIDDYQGPNEELYFEGTKGQLTGSLVKIFGTSSYLESCVYYDDKYRVIQTVAQNYQGGIDISSTKYDFIGKVLETRVEQQTELNDQYEEITLHAYNSYDHAGRLIQVDHMIEDGITNQRVTLTSLRYNELGEMIEKNLHDDALQSIDYNYNIRGWLTSINNGDLTNQLGDTKEDLFGMELNYNNIHSALNQESDRQYNGNISSVVWKHLGEDNQKAYGFTYDALNRIKTADFGQSEENWVNASFDVAGKNGESAISYDLNGNILSLGRKGTDDTYKSNFSYYYNGNQLKSMDRNGGQASTSSTHYQYDENGNMKRDEYKAANVYYNKLNLPKKVSFDDGRKVEYTYDASGVKRRMLRYNDDRTVVDTVDYAGSIIYKNGKFDYLLTGEGRVTKPTGGFVYEYHLKDHLGNTRVAFEATDGEAIIVQKSDYYPFGLKFDGYLNNDNKYLYNGKELQDDTNWLDYGARMYDPALGRFFTQDRFAEKYLDNTPYHYALNDPINKIDINGDSVVVRNGNLIGYIVEEGQGPSQIAADINNPETKKKYGYELNTEVDYLDIVNSNPDEFENVENVDDINDEGFKTSDLKTGELVSIGTVIDRESEFKGNEKQIGSISEKIGNLDKTVSWNEMKSDAAKSTAREVRQDGFAGAPGMSLSYMFQGGVYKQRANKYKKRRTYLSGKRDSLLNVNKNLKTR